ncbi:MAG TPA: hypothetical protein VHY21_04140 [Pseudonocardiaceae bacterium]|nr:hypothetical protein [Pseudonocardiaceae bacterium]
MTTHQMWVTAVAVWVIGLFMAWCLGYAMRERPDRARDSGLVGQLARTRLELDVLDHLDEHARLYCDAHRAPAPAPAPTPVAVHVHLAAPLPWPPHHPPMPLDGPRFLDAMPVLPAEEVQS